MCRSLATTTARPPRDRPGRPLGLRRRRTTDRAGVDRPAHGNRRRKTATRAARRHRPGTGGLRRRGPGHVAKALVLAGLVERPSPWPRAPSGSLKTASTIITSTTPKTIRTRSMPSRPISTRLSKRPPMRLRCCCFSIWSPVPLAGSRSATRHSMKRHRTCPPARFLPNWSTHSAMYRCRAPRNRWGRWCRRVTGFRAFGISARWRWPGPLMGTLHHSPGLLQWALTKQTPFNRLPRLLLLSRLHRPRAASRFSRPPSASPAVATASDSALTKACYKARRPVATCEQFGPEHLWSPSQFEEYAKCPYRFFCRARLAA